jgi:hypothetical protein
MVVVTREIRSDKNSLLTSEALPAHVVAAVVRCRGQGGLTYGPRLSP